MRKHAILITLLLLTQAAAAALPENRDSYQVAIPRSRIEMPSLAPEAPSAGPASLELGASSWAPGSFTLPGRIQDATRFSRANAPSLYINYLMPTLAMNGLSLKGGFNWLPLSRSGKVGDLDSQVTETQTLELVSVRIGAEYAPPALELSALQPYFGAALLPSLGLAGRSAFDEGSAYFGLPLEYSAGVQYSLSRMGVSWNQARLDLGMSGTFGTIHHSSVAGIGIKGGIRVGL